MDENCLLELLNECCCKCGYRDILDHASNDKTCCRGMYIVKEHGYCQGFKETSEIKDNENA